MKTRCIAAILALAAAPAFAHRLDEYLVATILSIANDRVDARMTLTPGVLAFPRILRDIDTDADGVISADEQHAYAARVLRDLSVTLDGIGLTPEISAAHFPPIDDMKEGRGEIQIDLHAALPSAGRHRSLRITNRHQPSIAAYQVNCLVPQDPRIRIGSQIRNYSQSDYQLEYEDTGVRDWSLLWLSPLLLLLCARVVWWRQNRA